MRRTWHHSSLGKQKVKQKCSAFQRGINFWQRVKKLDLQMELEPLRSVFCVCFWSLDNSTIWPPIEKCTKVFLLQRGFEENIRFPLLNIKFKQNTKILKYNFFARCKTSNPVKSTYWNKGEQFWFYHSIFSQLACFTCLQRNIKKSTWRSWNEEVCWSPC